MSATISLLLDLNQSGRFQVGLTTGFGHASILALLLTLMVLFAFQGEQKHHKQPLIIAMVAVPLLIQVFFNSPLAYWLRTARSVKSIALPVPRP